MASAVVHNKNYDNGHAFICVTIAIPGLLNGQQQRTLDIDCAIDTGFDKGIFLPDTAAQNIGAIDELPTIILILADGSEITAPICAGYIQKIDNHTFADPGKPVTIIIYKQSGGLVGMDALKYFSVTFNGLNQSFTITE